MIEFSPVCIIRHFFLIPLRWRIRQILLYLELGHQISYGFSTGCKNNPFHDFNGTFAQLDVSFLHQWVKPWFLKSCSFLFHTLTLTASSRLTDHEAYRLNYALACVIIAESVWKRSFTVISPDSRRFACKSGARNLFG